MAHSMRSAIVVSLCLAASSPLVASEPVGEPASSPLREQKATIEVIRDTGRAMFVYFATEVLQGRQMGSARHQTDDPERVDWATCPAVTYEEAAALLAPYLEPATVPRVDGWGHPLELCLRRAEGEGWSLGIRSPGRDGEFEGTVYAVGAFDPDDFDRDVVWLDGYFVTWPQRTAPEGSSGGS